MWKRAALLLSVLLLFAGPAFAGMATDGVTVYVVPGGVTIFVVGPTGVSAFGIFQVNASGVTSVRGIHVEGYPTSYSGVTGLAANVAGSAFIHSTGSNTLNASWSSLQGQRVTLTDSAGKVAYGYVGPVGTGETLGSEILSNPDFNAGVTGYTTATATLTSNPSGATGSGATLTQSAGGGYAYSGITGAVVGALYRINDSVKSGSLGAVTSRRGMISFPIATWRKYTDSTTTAGWIPSAMYATTGAVSDIFLFQHVSVSAGSVLYDELSVKRVLTPPTTGCSIYSTPALTTNSWASVESGFNWNSETFTVSTTPIVLSAPYNTDTPTMGTPLNVGGLTMFGTPTFKSGNSVGATTPTLGAEAPALGATTPYTWIPVKTGDGSTAYFPVWK